MAEGSHHKEVKCTLRITNSGKILSYWFKHPITGELIHTLCDETINEVQE